MNPKRRAFVNAYLGEANGNGTKAAIAAGYSEATARQAASRLLTQADIREAIGAKLQKADISTDRILTRLGLIANKDVLDTVEAKDVINASKVILQVNGALKDKGSDGRITVNIGFLSPQPATLTVNGEPVIDIEPTHFTSAEVMPPGPHVSQSGE